MARTPKEVTDAELTVLEVLWARGATPVRDIADELYPGGGNSKAATVQKLCERLEGKRYVRRNRKVRPATFAATVDREGLIGRRLKGLADKLCSGSYTPLLTQLVEAVDLSPEDIQRLRAHVDRLGDGSARGAGL
jgi:predicted transcriptional regulator